MQLVLILCKYPRFHYNIKGAIKLYQNIQKLGKLYKIEKIV